MEVWSKNWKIASMTIYKCEMMQHLLQCSNSLVHWTEEELWIEIEHAIEVAKNCMGMRIYVKQPFNKDTQWRRIILKSYFRKYDLP